MDILELALEQSGAARLNGTTMPVRPLSAASVTLVTKDTMIAIPYKIDESKVEQRCREFMDHVNRIAAEAKRVRENASQYPTRP